jgi:hypothetical protein
MGETNDCITTYSDSVDLIAKRMCISNPDFVAVPNY